MTQQATITDPNLLLLTATGDEQAFATLFHQQKQMVYNVGWSYTKDNILAEDILQDVFVHVWRKRETLTTVKDFSAWLYTVAKNRALNVLKKLATDRQRELKVGDRQPRWQPDHTKEVSDTEMESLLSQAVELLTPQQRRVFELSRIDGQSREAIAEQMGISPNTVKYHLGIAMRTVRSFLLSRLETSIVLLLFSAFFKK